MQSIFNKLHYLIIGLMFTVLLPREVQAQGTNCADAVVIGGLPYTSPVAFGRYTTCGSENNYNASHRCGNDFMDNEEFVFKYVAEPGVTCLNATINTTVENSIETALFLTRGCPDDPNGECVAQGMNIASSVNAGQATSINDVPIVPGETYYFLVVGIQICTDFSLDVQIGNCGARPEGADCNTAHTFTTLPHSITASTCTMSDYMIQGNNCIDRWQDGKEYILKYCPEQDECIKITGRAYDQPIRVSVFQDTCPTYRGNACPASYYNYYTRYSDTYYANVEAGHCYYYVISTRNDFERCSGFELTFEAMDDKGARCENAYVLDQNNQRYNNLTNRCKGDDYPEEYGCSGFQNTGEEVVFEYQSPGNECVVFTLENMSFNAGFYLYNQCPDDSNTVSLACEERSNWWASPDFLEIKYTFDTPGTYYLVVSSFLYKGTYGAVDFDIYYSSSSISPIGTDCENAHVLPTSPTVDELNLSTTCKGNDYGNGDACSSPVMMGDDYVLTYTPSTSFCGAIVLDNFLGSSGKGGMTVVNSCPDNPNANCLGAISNNSMADSIFLNFQFVAGQTYYIIVSAYEGYSVFEFDLHIKPRSDIPACNDCNLEECEACVDASLELAKFRNWSGGYGNTANSLQTEGIDFTYINAPYTRHTIVSAGAYDEVVPMLSCTSPYGGEYALRLGNNYDYAGAEQITYTHQVTAEYPYFFYAYAVVQEGRERRQEHITNAEAYFEVSMTDQFGIEIICANNKIASENSSDFEYYRSEARDQTNNGFFEIQWKDWSLVGVPLNNYIGQTVRITFYNRDCDDGAHMGYTYIDAFCKNLEIEKSNPGLCAGESITLTAPEGFSDYLWNTGETTREITVNAGGTYVVNLTSYGNGCVSSLNVAVAEYTLPTPNFSTPYPQCDSSVPFTDLSISNDTTTLAKWYWDFGDGTFDSIQNPVHSYNTVGIYDVELIVETSQGCKNSIIKQVRYSNPTIAVDSISNPICYLDNNGFIRVKTDNGIKPYTYELNGSIRSDSNFKNLNAGTYEIIITDDYGCKDSLTAVIEQPPRIKASMIITNIGCGTNSNFGQIQVAGMRGTGGFEYSLDGGDFQSSGLFTDLEAGEYAITIKDSLGCILDTTASIIVIINDLTMTASKSDLTCFNDESGQIVAHARLGQTAYQYSIDGTTYQNDSIFSGLSSGSYEVLVRDANGCIASELIELNQPDDINIEKISFTKAFCDSPSGTMQVGVSPEGVYNHYWFDMPGFTNMTSSGTDGFKNDLLPGEHGVIVDNETCRDTLYFTTDSQKSFMSSIGLTKAYCDSSNGTAILSINPSDRAYSFDWFDASGTPIGPFDTEASNLSIGDYSVTIYDDYCTETHRFTIEDGGTLYARFSGITIPTCGENNGEASVEVLESSGGTVSYLWSPSGQTTSNATGLETGSHAVTISDDHCSLILDTVLSTPEAVNAQIDTIIATTCNLNNGSIYVSASSGSGTYSYQWYQMPGEVILSGEVNPELTGVAAGDYKVIIDDGDCALTLHATVNALPLPAITLGNITPASCGFINGAIDVSSSSGMGAHSYNWYKNSNFSAPIASGVSTNLAGLDSGCYAIVVYDDYCSDTLFDVCVPYWDRISVTITDSSASYCGSNNGMATAMVSDGSGNVQFNWYTLPLPGNWVGNGDRANGLSPGCYAVIAEDLSYGCFDTASVCIADSASPNLSISSISASSCNDDNGAACVEVTGGTGNYSFNWFEVADASRALVSSSNCISPARPTSYRVIVFDGNCYDSLDILIPNDPAIDINLVDSGDEFCEANNGFIEVLASLGTGNYNYTWYQTPDGASFGNSARIENITSGDYCVSVYDGQCYDTLCVTIDSIPSPVAQVTVVDASCEQSNGSATATASGGNGNFNYQWFDKAGTLVGSGINISGLDSGNYTLVVTDDYCSDTLSFFIDMHQSPVLVLDMYTDAYCLEANGYARVSVTGDPDASFSFIWPNGISHTDGTGNSFSDALAAGDYCVIVMDEFCSDTLCFTISDPGLMSVSASSLQDTCFNARGMASVSVTGGTTPYSYLWSNGASSSSIESVMAGDYTVTITDANDCEQEVTISVANFRNTIDQNNSFISFSPKQPQERDTVYFKATIAQNQWKPYSWFNLDGAFDGSKYATSIFYPSETNDVVCLEVMDLNQCLDTLCTDIYIEPQVAIYIPNAFSPNKDGDNELWMPSTKGIVKLQGVVYDRWGKRVFEFQNINDSWNGTNQNGDLIKQDVYAYQFTFSDRYGKVHERSGSVIVLN